MLHYFLSFKKYKLGTQGAKIGPYNGIRVLNYEIIQSFLPCKMVFQAVKLVVSCPLVVNTACCIVSHSIHTEAEICVSTVGIHISHLFPLSTFFALLGGGMFSNFLRPLAHFKHLKCTYTSHIKTV